MLRHVYEWIDKKQEEAFNDENEGRGISKSVGLGALEGAIEASVILGGMVIVQAFVNIIRGSNK